MKVHTFGNTQSRVTFSYGLRKASLLGDNYARDFVNKNFYVDNGPTSLSIKQDAIHLMRKTNEVLNENGNTFIRLYKIVLISVHVVKALLADDLGSDLKQLNLCAGTCNLLVQHSLGMS